MFSGEKIFQQGDEVGTIRKNRGQKATQLETKLLITTGTPTQQPKTIQLHCSIKLVLFSFTSAAQSTSAEPIKSKFSFTELWLFPSLAAFWWLKLIRQMSMWQLHCCCTACWAPKLQGRGTEKPAGPHRLVTKISCTWVHWCLLL